ncbi:hypothetical protein [Haladaptatus cibarius]|uniref:hypothetical protein n=1 Tax=Haladaptatus cibarius TaxID=453847 RepID=UPI000679781C|nr:hypothetical protein [Haladaptatus cibarius]
MATLKGVLTGIYARLLLGGIKKTEKYQTKGIERIVYWVDTDGWMAGQYTPWGTIILNKNKLRERPDDLEEFTFLHEVGHSQMHLLPRILLIPLLLSSALGLFSLPFLLISMLSSALSAPTSQQPYYAMAFLIVSALVVLYYVIVTWIDEGYAELFVLSKIGAVNYQECHRKAHESSHSGLLKRIRICLTYPHPKLVVWAGEKLGKT